ncbi:MAG: ATP-binding protein [Gemmatimonadetes bacterium]|nr:ATP-binding protein [Gemmatimonadota bacterium]
MAALEPLALPAVLDSLAELRAFARRASEAAGLEEGRRYALELAVDEIATNVILHGYGAPDPSRRVWISAELEGGALRILLEDDGTPYDPREHRMPSEEELSAPLEDRPIGGLGIMLALGGVDAFDYRTREGRNVNVFEMRLPRG